MTPTAICCRRPSMGSATRSWSYAYNPPGTSVVLSGDIMHTALQCAEPQLGLSGHSRRISLDRG